MKIAVLKERSPNERRVAIVPEDAQKLQSRGYDVWIEKGAGLAAGFSDQSYQERQLNLGDRAALLDADLFIQIGAPVEQDILALPKGSIWISLLDPARNPDRLTSFARQGVTALALDSIPRISRAQSMDVLSSMAQLTGYRAVIEAAARLPRMVGGQITAAGKTAPAQVLVIGAGVAGLAAIGVARALGASVTAFDTRKEVIEQVESMGAQMLPLPNLELVEPSRSDGYAETASRHLLESEQALFESVAPRVDVVITTAMVPGQVAPSLLTERFIKELPAHGVVIDLAAAAGGNCSLTVADKCVRTERGVTIVGYTDFPSRIPKQASQLFSSNLMHLIGLLEKERPWRIANEDPLVRSMTVASNGEVTWPPPPVEIQKTTVPKQNTPNLLGSESSSSDDGRSSRVPRHSNVSADISSEAHSISTSRKLRYILSSVAGVAVLGLSSLASPVLLTQMTIFFLACVVGYYTVSGVTHALHTPLMSVTNAISGIIVVGALLQLGTTSIIIKSAAFVAIFVASINIFGGFAVTHRMLKMFRGKK